ncbi:glycine zipper 2TM domain-containing protein [Sphingomonas baiyangensis]|uniref:17 kDa surface antigen n=1 Tax=Sphingomonas baiyangensis TaxID=2572576 RepID=A0A4U1L6J9_9SPHN|nr:glycine zipper 2TM domain-containing protein [Sphingomonas baiyangensis]
MIAAAAGLAMPVAMAVPATKVEAKAAYGAAASLDQRRDRRYREWRGRDGRRYCRKPDGTTGLVVGGVAGALVGRTIDTRGDRTLGTVLGAAGGAVAGRAIERGGSRCR